MGVAVLDHSELIYYGVKTFKRQRPADELIGGTRAVLRQLIAEYQPDTLAYEETFYVQAKSSALLHVQEAEIKEVGRQSGLRVVGLSASHVRKRLCGAGSATKEIVAEALVGRFPYLVRYRADRRHTYWLNMFDAIAVAVVSMEEGPRLRASSVSGPSA